MRQRSKLVLLLALAGTSGSAAASAVQEYRYAPDAIYPVRAALGIATQIELAPDEQIKDFGTGFSAAWDLVRRDNVFYLKPKQAQADTNMHIRTAQRSYLFDLTVQRQHWRNLRLARQAGVHYKIRFQYPGAVAATDTFITTPQKAPEHQDYDFAADTASLWLRPARVHDDRRFTYLQLGPKAVQRGGTPAVFARKTIDGEEFLVNSHYQDDRLTVHGVYPFLVLRHGEHVLGLRRN